MAAEGGVISPLAPASYPTLLPIAGIRLGAVEAGIRYQGRTDLMVVLLDEGTRIAGVFTKSKAPGQPVLWCREILPHGRARAIIVNSGNANVFTGKAGRQAVEATVSALAGLLGCPPHEIYVSSTGVIGEILKTDRLIAALPQLVRAAAADQWSHAAAAIMTTDTYPKMATRRAEIGGVEVVLNGFCKGSGMIQPDMATMLAYVFTDADLPAPVLQTLLSRAVAKSFNAITVDGDTSTSDTLLFAATAKASNPPVQSADDAKLRGFAAALDDLMIELAQQVVRDGEGAEKFVEIRVTGAVSAQSARKIGLTIGNSPLVKTAIAASDANWGRIVAAIGRAGEPVDRDTLSISIGGTVIAAEGGLVPGYDETPVAAHMRGRNILIEVALGLGRGKATIWTCDLTHRYIDINGSYRS